jgi:hypothetical protein
LFAGWRSGQVIHALTENGRHISTVTCKLTRLLQDSLKVATTVMTRACRLPPNMESPSTRLLRQSGA